MNVLLLAGAAAGGFLVGVVTTLAWSWYRSRDTQQSARAHEAAQQRAPPVELGETYEFTITEFSDHHSGDRVAVGKVEGFVLFTEDIPSSVGVGDVIAARVDSFNDGRTSADATFQSTA